MRADVRGPHPGLLGTIIIVAFAAVFEFSIGELQAEPVVTAPGPSTAATPTTPTERPWAVLTGMPSSIHVQTYLPWKSRASRPCARFRVITLRPQARVEVATSGLGGTVLAAVPPIAADDPCLPRKIIGAGESRKTPASPWSDHIVLEAAGGSPAIIDRWVAARIDVSSLTADGTTMDGRIMALAPGERPVDTPLKVDRLPGSPFFTAATWFLGIIIPAGATAILGYLGTRAVSAATARAGFRSYVVDHPGPITNFIRNQVRATLVAEGISNPLRRLLEDMYQKELLSKLPSGASKRLRAICASEDKQAFLVLLAKLFPEMGHTIDEIRNEIGNA